MHFEPNNVNRKGRNLYAYYYIHVNAHNQDAAMFASMCNFMRDYHTTIRTEIIVCGCFHSLSPNTPEFVHLCLFMCLCFPCHKNIVYHVPTQKTILGCTLQLCTGIFHTSMYIGK